MRDDGDVRAYDDADCHGVCATIILSTLRCRFMLMELMMLMPSNPVRSKIWRPHTMKGAK